MFKEDIYFGQYGGTYVPEMMIPALQQLEESFIKYRDDKAFKKELDLLNKSYIGRPTSLYFAENLSNHLGGARIYLKNEGLCHTGAHKINHCVGQALLAKRMGKKKIIAETGAGQHGVATAAVCAKLGLECTVYMGEVDYHRQKPNVFWMENYGANVIPVKEGTRTLKDAVNAAIKGWINSLEDSYYLLGSALGPYPYPQIVKYFQSVVGRETKYQLKDFNIDNPDYVVACVGGGSNSIGIFSAFLDNTDIKLIGVEAGGYGEKTGENAARFSNGARVGISEGYKSLFLQTKDGQISNTSSVSAGLDYPGVGPEHAYLNDQGRVQYEKVSDKEALSAFKLLAEKEGISAALESSHAVAYAVKLASKIENTKNIVINLSGRADKDLFILAKEFQDESFFDFLRNYLNE